MKKKLNYTYAVGKRKSSIARVRLFKALPAGRQGNEENTVNEILVEKYFTGANAQVAWNKPFEELGFIGKYYFTTRVTGGGKKGQLDAVTHGLARALSKVKEAHRIPLRKAGLLTRDSRIRERRKMNTGGKARRRKQSPKR